MYLCFHPEVALCLPPANRSYAFGVELGYREAVTVVGWRKSRLIVLATFIWYSRSYAFGVYTATAKR